MATIVPSALMLALIFGLPALEIDVKWSVLLAAFGGYAVSFIQFGIVWMQRVGK